MTPPATSGPGSNEEPPRRRISAYTSRPERTVFTESGNPDGWIATDATVDVER